MKSLTKAHIPAILVTMAASFVIGNFLLAEGFPGSFAHILAIIGSCAIGVVFLPPKQCPEITTAKPAQKDLAPTQSTLRSAELPKIAQHQTKPAPTIAQHTEQIAAPDIVARLAALPALAGLAQDDICKVIEKHRAGTTKSAIYRELGWASAKHSKIVKPIIEALLSLEGEG